MHWRKFRNLRRLRRADKGPLFIAQIIKSGTHRVMHYKPFLSHSVLSGRHNTEDILALFQVYRKAQLLEPSIRFLADLAGDYRISRPSNLNERKARFPVMSLPNKMEIEFRVGCLQFALYLAQCVRESAATMDTAILHLVHEPVSV
ncbi:hypothetical protein DSM109990_01792 [Sulfitobacter dubius]|uniref:Uncharacterized protein n=1 Tax=Sulfitobacter dubius TaxID=218673 RepID=A0ABY3ZK85_9RHOB|nr:hypothetical protein DSM109990_01792 [Sulfitobacter dubius]